MPPRCDEFQVVAHRGFKAHYAENTLISFEKALEAGATMIELDVRMTRDEVVVILHDATLLRLGNRRRHVSAMLWEKLQEINLYDKKARHLKSGSVLTLEKLLQTLGPRIRYYIEIKASKNHGNVYRHKLCRHVVELVSRYGLLDLAFFVSFDLPLLPYLHSLDPALSLGLNYEGKTPSSRELQFLEEVGAALCPDEVLLEEKEQVAAFKERGFKIFPWVVNEPPRMKELISWGVDGITSDFPDRLAAVRQGMLH